MAKGVRVAVTDATRGARTTFNVDLAAPATVRAAVAAALGRTYGAAAQPPLCALAATVGGRSIEFDEVLKAGDAVEVAPLLAPGGPLIIYLADETGAVFSVSVTEAPKMPEDPRPFFESVALFAVDAALTKHALAQGWEPAPMLRMISRGAYRVELRVAVRDNLPNNCDGGVATLAVESTFTPMEYKPVTMEDTLEDIMRTAFRDRQGAACALRCDLRGFRAPEATEVVVALTVAGRPEPTITARLLDADLAGISARDVLRTILKARFLDKAKPPNYEFDLAPASGLDLLFTQKTEVKEGVVDKLLDAPDMVLSCRATDAGAPSGAFLSADPNEPLPFDAHVLPPSETLCATSRNGGHVYRRKQRRVDCRVDCAGYKEGTTKAAAITPITLAPVRPGPDRRPQEVLVLLRDRDGAVAYEAFPLHDKGAVPALLLAEEALAEFRRSGDLAEDPISLRALECRVGPPGEDTDAAAIVDAFLAAGASPPHCVAVDATLSVNTMLQTRADLRRDAFDRTGRRYAVLWCRWPGRLVPNLVVQLRVVAREPDRVVFAEKVPWRGVAATRLGTATLLERAVACFDESAEPFEAWAPRWRPGAGDAARWFEDPATRVDISLVAADGALTTRTCRGGAMTVHEVMRLDLNAPEPRCLTLDVYADVGMPPAPPPSPDDGDAENWRAVARGVGFFDGARDCGTIDAQIRYVTAANLSGALSAATRSRGFAATLGAPWAGHDRRWRLGVLWLAAGRRSMEFLNTAPPRSLDERDDLVRRVVEAAARGLRGRQPALALLHAVLVARFAHAAYLDHGPSCVFGVAVETAPRGVAAAAASAIKPLAQPPDFSGYDDRQQASLRTSFVRAAKAFAGVSPAHARALRAELEDEDAAADGLCRRALDGLDDPAVAPIPHGDDELLASILAQVPARLPCFEVVRAPPDAPALAPPGPAKKRKARRKKRRQATPVSEDEAECVRGDDAAAANLAQTSLKADELIEAVDASVARFDGLSASVRALADREAAKEAVVAAQEAINDALRAAAAATAARTSLTAAAVRAALDAAAAAARERNAAAAELEAAGEWTTAPTKRDRKRAAAERDRQERTRRLASEAAERLTLERAAAEDAAAAAAAAPAPPPAPPAPPAPQGPPAAKLNDPAAFPKIAGAPAPAPASQRGTAPLSPPPPAPQGPSAPKLDDQTAFPKIAASPRAKTRSAAKPAAPAKAGPAPAVTPATTRAKSTTTRAKPATTRAKPPRPSSIPAAPATAAAPVAAPVAAQAAAPTAAQAAAPTAAPTAAQAASKLNASAGEWTPSFEAPAPAQQPEAAARPPPRTSAYEPRGPAKAHKKKRPARKLPPARPTSEPQHQSDYEPRPSETGAAPASNRASRRANRAAAAANGPAPAAAPVPSAIAPTPARPASPAAAPARARLAAPAVPARPAAPPMLSPGKAPAPAAPAKVSPALAPTAPAPAKTPAAAAPSKVAAPPARPAALGTSPVDAKLGGRGTSDEAAAPREPREPAHRAAKPAAKPSAAKTAAPAGGAPARWPRAASAAAPRKPARSSAKPTPAAAASPVPTTAVPVFKGSGGKKKKPEKDPAFDRAGFEKRGFGIFEG